MPPNKQSGFLAQTEADYEGGPERLKSLQVPGDADVIVLQRPAHPLQPDMIDILRANKVAVVVDMDDDMSNIHPDNVAYHMYRHTNAATPFSWRHATESCKRATLVTTSTAELQRVYAKHGRGQVIDNFVPGAYLTMPKSPTGSFGWTGTLKSHPNDLQVTRPFVARLVDEGYMFTVVGDGRGIKGALGLKHDPFSSGFIGLMDWERTIAESMDVGIVPLAPTAFNSSKSRLKGIEFMAVGVPWVASPRAEYRKLQKDAGCGFLAEKPKDWYTMVKRLMDNDSLREEQAQAGIEYMKDQTYEQQAWRQWEAWERALTIQRG